MHRADLKHAPFVPIVQLFRVGLSVTVNTRQIWVGVALANCGEQSSVCIEQLALSANCGFCLSRILLYFHISVRVSVRLSAGVT